MQRSFTSHIKSVFILIVTLIAPLSFCNAQDIWYNEKTGLVESTTDKAIDLSKIASDWLNLREKVAEQDSIIQEKDKTIEKLASLSQQRLSRIDELTDVVIEQNERVDEISDEQLKTAMSMWSNFSLSAELTTDPKDFNLTRATARLSYRIGKIYIIGTASAGNDFNELRTGIGYTFF